MEHLLGRSEDLESLFAGKRIFLFLDCDGTLAPIKGSPDEAVVPKETRILLEGMRKNPKLKLAIISGRAIRDVKRIVGVEGLLYAGNHGLEIEGPELKFEAPVPLRSKEVIKKIKGQLMKGISDIKGALLEDKGLTLSLHYRLVNKKGAQLVKVLFNETVKPYLANRLIKVTSGKKVFEIRPPVEWDKGKVVLWLLARSRFSLGGEDIFPIYIGDDITDEDAFKALKDKGVGVFVGKPKTSQAKYYLRNPREVRQFLKWLN